jgi:serine O-acetyltransferase
MGWLADFRCDLQRYVDDGLTPWRAVLTQQGAWASLEYRLARALRHRPLMGPAFVVSQKLIEATTGISLGHGATIGPGLWITHLSGVIVQDQAVIGNDCHLCQGATVGRGDGTGGYGAPVIGDRVYVGPHVALLGKITVGDDVRVNANSVVTADIPDGSAVWPAPAVVQSPADLPLGLDELAEDLEAMTSDDAAPLARS